MIYFAGAGCGAADLITVRGMKLLEKADVVIYGSDRSDEKGRVGEQDGSAPAYRGAKSLRRSQGADGLSR